MTQMSMGSNIALSAAGVRAALRWTAGPGVPEVDASALMLDADGEVSSDADFVFYNQPQHHSGAVWMAGKTPAPQASDQVDIDLTRVPVTTTRIVLAASADGGTFGAVPDLQLVLTDLATGETIAAFPMQAGAETAFVSAEIYRRNDDWKFRAVGQGYSSGLAGLAADFGIDTGAARTDDAPSPAQAAPPPPAPPPPPVPPVPPTAPTAPPAPPAPPPPLVTPYPPAPAGFAPPAPAGYFPVAPAHEAAPARPAAPAAAPDPPDPPQQ